MSHYPNAEGVADRYAGLVNETNGLLDPVAYRAVDRSLRLTMPELSARGGRLTRVRFLTEPGWPFLDLSYAHGVLPDGTGVTVSVYTSQPNRRTYRSQLQAECLRGGMTKTQVTALGVWDSATYSTLY
jgi:hypothetical protein